MASRVDSYSLLAPAWGNSYLMPRHLLLAAGLAFLAVMISWQRVFLAPAAFFLGAFFVGAVFFLDVRGARPGVVLEALDRIWCPAWAASRS